MTHLLFLIAAALLFLGTLAHTLGGMLRMAQTGPGAGAEADRVLSEMKQVRFSWRGFDTSWFGFWMGNGLGVSALLLLAITVLVVLGTAGPEHAHVLLPIAWAAGLSLVLMTVLGTRYFGGRVAGIFGLIAGLVLCGAGLLTAS